MLLEMSALQICVFKQQSTSLTIVGGGGKIKKNDIGALIFISQSADYSLPATAYILQDRLNLPKNLIAFDVSLGCSGFVYGLYLASSILNSLGDKKVMVCCGDVRARSKHPKDTGSGAIFGDAGACVIVSKESPIRRNHVTFNFHSYGERWESLVYKRSGARYANKVMADPSLVDPKNVGEPAFMDGMAIMDFTLHEVIDNIEELLQAENLSKDDIGAYLFHQPQKLLIDSMANSLGVDPELVIFNSQHIGNTSSASIPLILTEIGRDWNKRKNKKVLMSGFGVGLSVASAILDLDSTICLETKKYE